VKRFGSKPRGIVPEFRVEKKRTRAGFAPAHFDEDNDVEIWQVWCQNAEGEESRRATFEDLEKAGFKPGRRTK
jgi:hypothetical protein